MSVPTALRAAPPAPVDAMGQLARPFALTRIDEARINVATQDELVQRIVSDAAAGVGGTVFTLNLDHLVKLEHDPAFRAAYQRATYVTADGIPVVLIARAKGVAIERVTGADLVEPLCRAAAEAGVGVYFFGTRPAVLDRAADVLREKAPGLIVSGREAPKMGFDPFGSDAMAAAEAIETSGAGICFVALGAPKQELFANAAMARTDGIIYVCIGAALDFQAGTQARAPRLLSEYGLEWLWRLVHDPRRLTKRYVRSAGWLLRYMIGRVVRRGVILARTASRELMRDVRDRDSENGTRE